MSLNHEKVCEYCGKSFIAKNILGRFCNSSCKDKSWEKNNLDKYRAKLNRRKKKRKASYNYNIMCPICQATWEAHSKNAKYCSIECARANRYKMNPGKYIAYVVNRRAIKSYATIKGFNKELEAIYIEAKYLEKLDGIKQYVHHIVPLQEFNSVGVYSLHVPWNLQIVTKEEHLEKHRLLRHYHFTNNNSPS